MDIATLQELQDFRKLTGCFRASRVMLTANNLGVFENAKKPVTAAALARKLKADGRATGILLDAVASLGLLKKTGSQYRNTTFANRFLVSASPVYQGDMLRHMDHLWKSWSGLDEVVKSGKPNRARSRDYEVFIRAMHNNAVLRAPMVIEAINVKGVKTSLDLGGGPGTYSEEFAKHGIAATLFDMPEAVRIARKLVKQRSVRFLAGDFHTDDIGSGYDLVLISQILHSLSPAESIALLKKATRALNPGGRIVIHEFTLNENRAAPAGGALFSVNMLVNTPGGRCYTPKEMKSWLVKAGLANVAIKNLGETILVMGRNKK